MKRLACVLVLLAPAARAAAQDAFLVKHCFDCHDGQVKKGGLDLEHAPAPAATRESLEFWTKVHDRVQGGEMPPPKKARPAAAEQEAYLASLGKGLREADLARRAREGRAELRRLTRVEIENSLRDLLALPGLRVKEMLPEDGKAHGYDRLAQALDVSFVHVEAYLAAVDKALNEALCAFPEKPPVFQVRYRPWDNTRHNGREAEGSFIVGFSGRVMVPLTGLTLDPTFDSEKFAFRDAEPKANAVGMFRHEDADHLWNLTGVAPVLSGLHRIRLRGYSFDWDGSKVVPTERHGAISVGIHSTGEHYGTIGVPPNEAGEGEIFAWLERGGGMTHGTHDTLKINPASVQRVRDFRHGKNKDVPGPLVPVPGVAIEWFEMEGPLHETWPPASHVALFGDLPVKEWTKESGAPKPRQQEWRRGTPSTLPKEIYGERGQKRPTVHVESKDPAGDATRLLSAFLPKAFRRPVTDAEVASYAGPAARRVAEGAAFQDSMIAAYRAALCSPDFLHVVEQPGALKGHALARRLASFLWASTPDDELLAAADRGVLEKPEGLRAQAERLLKDPKGRRFAEQFLGQWLSLREITATQPDTKLYPEFMPWHQEAMLLEAQAYFEELLREDLGAARLVSSDFAMINEPLAELYGIPGVRGWAIRKVPLPPDHPRASGMLTLGAVLKVTANGTTTSPVKRGAFVMERILGIVPSPPPPDAGSIEPDVRGAVTIRQQLEKHRENPACAGCHRKMDGYGFALESFDVIGGRRDAYRALGGGAKGRLHGHGLAYKLGLPVECAGEMPDGRAFKDLVQMRALLAADPARLARAFAGHLLVYATGGELTFADRDVVDAIARRAAPRGYGLRTLLHEVIQSPAFRAK